LSPRFAYLYFMKNEPERVRAAVRQHVSHWQEQELREYLGGPFADRSGGLITFDAGDAEEAERLVRGDPFLVEGLLESYWLKQWIPE
jgi:uncharacterized protein YciI